MVDPFTIIADEESPFVAAAIHDGHALRPAVAEAMQLPELERLREEDPHTGRWAEVASSRIVGLNSRFEVDLNRPPEQCVYQTPEDCWGLHVWKEPLSSDIIEESREIHRRFYQAVHELLTRLVTRHRFVLVYDLHTYNFRRSSPEQRWEYSPTDPDINIGTGTMNREWWSPVIDPLISSLQKYRFFGRPLDVRENVRFRGGYFPRWIHEQFPTTVCCPAIEMKKFFMDEWTGEANEDHVRAIQDALRNTLPATLSALHSFAGKK